MVFYSAKVCAKFSFRETFVAENKSSEKGFHQKSLRPCAGPRPAPEASVLVCTQQRNASQSQPRVLWSGICAGGTNIPNVRLFVLFSNSKCMIFIKVHHGDKSTGGLAPHLTSLLVSEMEFQQTAQLFFLVDFRKPSSGFAHLPASGLLRRPRLGSAPGPRPAVPRPCPAGSCSGELAGTWSWHPPKRRSCSGKGGSVPLRPTVTSPHFLFHLSFYIFCPISFLAGPIEF